MILLKNTNPQDDFYITFILVANIEAGLAQSVERRTLNPVVVGSSPTVGVSFFHDLLISRKKTDHHIFGSTLQVKVV
jgi:hypothetical protein